VSIVDQNAFGVLVAFYDIEDAEYGLEPEEFVARCERFRELVLDQAREQVPAARLHAIDLGHALYFEFEDGDQLEDPMAWLRAVARRLGEAEFAVAAVLAHGGRWVDDSAEPAGLRLDDAAEGAHAEGADRHPSIVRVTRSSEALRRALYAEAATHGSDGDDGWGPGVFVDEEAVLALKRSFKNAPTPLLAGGARFFRVGS
jgi:hypothetical protein